MHWLVTDYCTSHMAEAVVEPELCSWMISKIVPGWFQRHLILFFNFCVWIRLMFKPNPWWWTLHVGMPQQRQAASSVALIITYFLLSPDVDEWKPFTLSQLSWKTRQLRVPTGRASVPPLAIEVGTTVPTAKWHPQCHSSTSHLQGTWLKPKSGTGVYFEGEKEWVCMPVRPDWHAYNYFNSTLVSEPVF